MAFSKMAELLFSSAQILIKDSDYAKCCGAQAISPPSTEDWQIILINFIFVFFLILVVCHMYGDKSAWGHAWLPFCVGLYFAVAIFVRYVIECTETLESDYRHHCFVFLLSFCEDLELNKKKERE